MLIHTGVNCFLACLQTHGDVTSCQGTQWAEHWSDIRIPPSPRHTPRSWLGLQQCGEWDSLGEHRCLLKGHLEPSSLSTAFQGKALGFSPSAIKTLYTEIWRWNLAQSTSQSATKYFLVGINILPSNLKSTGHHWQLLTHPTIFKVRAAYFRSLTWVINVCETSPRWQNPS